MVKIRNQLYYISYVQQELELATIILESNMLGKLKSESLEKALF